ncbi:FAD/NAD(P)-binding domain-containing protein [Pyrenochaeta sp. DS3sAY3a]|nr:FAD/NAD(P)-binding domain-containing protein [Pyrenochaeta sp. DS3sAY3a]
MEETDVIIVGAGPSGLALAVALAHYNVKSIILEKNADICEDPRAIAISGDTPRITELLGISSDALQSIAQVMPEIHFHNGAFTNQSFYSIDHNVDWLEQTIAPGIVILQPRLEIAFRNLLKTLESTELRTQCTVSAIEEIAGGIQIQYERPDGSVTNLKGRFLVGADGKRGYVRKSYLESKGIEQVSGIYQYEATWIAANLYITLPTPTSHPDFPLWKLGYHPEELWNIFWPPGFHFCRHPLMPVATGRFGPENEKHWRFEYELPPNFLPPDLEQHLDEQMRPHLTLPGSRFSRNGITTKKPVIFPKDCVQILRLGPANFSQKVVNRWFHNNVMLIGDAAHVFPPFGAQGIANGIRDALGLSWRLNLLCNANHSPQLVDRDALLESWSRERRKGVDDSSILTAGNGSVLLGKSWVSVLAMRVMGNILKWVPSIRDSLLRQQFTDASGYVGVQGGFFLSEDQGGGRKAAQIYVKKAKGDIMLSDRLVWESKAPLTLLLLRTPSTEEALDIDQVLKDVSLPRSFLAQQPLHYCHHDELHDKNESVLSTTKFSAATANDLNEAGISVLHLYDVAGFRNRFHRATMFVLLRQDFIIFSQAQTTSQLVGQINQAVTKLAQL